MSSWRDFGGMHQKLFMSTAYLVQNLAWFVFKLLRDFRGSAFKSIELNNRSKYFMLCCLLNSQTVSRLIMVIAVTESVRTLNKAWSKCFAEVTILMIIINNIYIVLVNILQVHCDQRIILLRIFSVSDSLRLVLSNVYLELLPFPYISKSTMIFKLVKSSKLKIVYAENELSIYDFLC